MGVFVVFRISDRQKLEAAIKSAYPDDHYKLDSGEWLISAKGTARKVSDAIGVSEAENGVAIVARISSYFGRAPTDVWDWISAKMEGDSG